MLSNNRLLRSDTSGNKSLFQSIQYVFQFVTQNIGLTGLPVSQGVFQRLLEAGGFFNAGAHGLSPCLGPGQELQALVDERTQALAQANNQLQLLSNTDSLTGIANRRHFDQALAHEWARAQRAHAPVSLIMLDVDVFKHFNDHYGHLAGDACLKSLALTLAQTGGRRDGDVVARFGGEEFVVLLPGADAPAALEVAQHIQQAIQALALPHEGAPHGIVTVSFGVATMAPQREQLAEELVCRADRAMYRAKQGGRNRIEQAPEP